MAREQTIKRLDGSKVRATYIAHCRTLTGGRCNHDVELFRLKDGAEIECISPSGDARVMPIEVDQSADHYPGHRPGE
jgi:hypothetical protein